LRTFGQCYFYIWQRSFIPVALATLNTIAVLSVFASSLLISMLVLPQLSLSIKNAEAYNPCNCVIFRLDDVEDQGNSNVPNVALLQHFITNNHKLGTEIIVNNFGNLGTSATVFNTVKQGYDQGLFEVGIHGFKHVRHSQLTEEQQSTDLGNAKIKLKSLFNDPNLRVFTPPFNDFNSDTIKAMAENSLDIFSTSYSTERTTTNIYKISNSFQTDNSIIQLSEVTVFDNDTGQHFKRRVYHVPYDISLFNLIEPTGTLSGQSLIDAVLSKVATQIANTGFAVVTLHPTDIAPYDSGSRSWSNGVSNTKFQDLKDIITGLEAKGYGFPFMSDIAPAPFSQIVPGGTGTALLTLNSITNVGWGTDITVTGKLTDSSSSAAIANANIKFDGTGATNLTSVVTNTDGTFTAKGKAPSTVGTGWKVQAYFTGDSAYDATSSLPKTYNTISHSVTIAVAASKSTVPWGAATSFTATMTDTTVGVASGTPVTGKTVKLDGTGVIGGAVSDQVTDGNGKATFTGLAPNTVAAGWTYQAHFAGDSLYKKFDSTIKTYSTIKHTVSLGLAVLKTGDPPSTTSTTVAPGGSYKVQGTLLDTVTSSPLGSKTITLTADAPITISSKTTNTNGFYSGTQTAPSTPGTYNIQSHFAADDLYNAKDSVMRTLTVSGLQTTTLTLTKPSAVPWGKAVTLAATLKDSSGQAIPGAAITFDNNADTNIGSAQTDASGKAVFTVTSPSSVGTFPYAAHYAGDGSLYNKADAAGTYSTIKHTVSLGLAVLKTGDPPSTTSTTVAPGGSYKVQGTLLDTVTPSPLVSKTITLTADAPITISSKTTNTNGFYSGTQTAPSTPGTYNIQSHFAADNLYNAKDSVMRTLTVSGSTGTATSSSTTQQSSSALTTMTESSAPSTAATKSYTENSAPIADAGPNKVVKEGTKDFSLDGTRSNDLDGVIEKYHWELIAGPRLKLDTASNPGHAIFDVPEVQKDNTKLIFKLAVEDDKGKKSENSDNIIVIIRDVNNNNNDNTDTNISSSSRTDNKNIGDHTGNTKSARTNSNNEVVRAEPANGTTTTRNND
jgi:peptidoglycan/xylan/chitin deacetylase (PgdA/CDA1 family)